MIVIRAAQEVFDRNENTNIEWVRSKNHIADGLAKIEYCKLLEAGLCEEQMIPMNEQWIKRATPIDGHHRQQSSKIQPDSLQKKARCTKQYIYSL